MQHYTIFCNRKNAERQEPKNTGWEWEAGGLNLPAPSPQWGMVGSKSKDFCLIQGQSLWYQQQHVTQTSFEYPFPNQLPQLGNPILAELAP